MTSCVEKCKLVAGIAVIVGESGIGSESAWVVHWQGGGKRLGSSGLVSECGYVGVSRSRTVVNLIGRDDQTHVSHQKLRTRSPPNMDDGLPNGRLPCLLVCRAHSHGVVSAG